MSSLDDISESIETKRIIKLRRPIASIITKEIVLLKMHPQSLFSSSFLAINLLYSSLHE